MISLNKRMAVTEALAVIIVLIIILHLLVERIESRPFPQGDEGSWMSVAAEFCRGNGFTTRWLEHPFLIPYNLPRPDDYRFPALTLLLALGFKLMGISYYSALKTVAAIFLIFCFLLYYSIRKNFGIRTAFITLAISGASLLQLHWNTMVYTEGLFGVGISIAVLLCSTTSANRFGYWIKAGLATALLYYIRPNGILFAVAIICVYLLKRKKERLPWHYLASALLIMLAAICPWLIRNFIYFRNPFHVAGSAGLLRASLQEPLTYSLIEFIKRHGLLYFPKTALVGFVEFWSTLHFFEHGLEIAPLGLAIVSLALKRRFFDEFITIGFLVTFICCCYVSHNDWAGVRYFSSFIPFIYAYGVRSGLYLTDKVLSRFNVLSRSLSAITLTFFLLVPVYYPHRYYERVLPTKPRPDQLYAEHLALLSTMLPPQGFYLANSLSQINFLTQYRCIGMQEFFDTTEALRAIDHFAPTLIVLSHNEAVEQRFRILFNFILRNGIELEKAAVNKFAYYYRMSYNYKKNQK